MAKIEETIDVQATPERAWKLFHEDRCAEETTSRHRDSSNGPAKDPALHRAIGRAPPSTMRAPSPERADRETASYAVWADFARYPEFVKGVERVERRGDLLHWVAGSKLKTNEWDAHITAEEPGRRLAWQAPEGPIDTEITFEPLPDGGTRVLFREHMHDSVPAQAAAASGLGGRRAQSDLERCKEIVEGG